MKMMILDYIFARETMGAKISKVSEFIYNTISGASGPLLCLCFKTRTLRQSSPHLPCEPLVQNPSHWISQSFHSLFTNP